jgi:hypothetical protein
MSTHSGPSRVECGGTTQDVPCPEIFSEAPYPEAVKAPALLEVSIMNTQASNDADFLKTWTRILSQIEIYVKTWLHEAEIEYDLEGLPLKVVDYLGGHGFFWIEEGLPNKVVFTKIMISWVHASVFSHWKQDKELEVEYEGESMLRSSS